MATPTKYVREQARDEDGGPLEVYWDYDKRQDGWRWRRASSWRLEFSANDYLFLNDPVRFRLGKTSRERDDLLGAKPVGEVDCSPVRLGRIVAFPGVPSGTPVVRAVVQDAITRQTFDLSLEQLRPLWGNWQGDEPDVLALPGLPLAQMTERFWAVDSVSTPEGEEQAVSDLVNWLRPQYVAAGLSARQTLTPSVTSGPRAVVIDIRPPRPGAEAGAQLARKKSWFEWARAYAQLIAPERAWIIDTAGVVPLAQDQSLSAVVPEDSATLLTNGALVQVLSGLLADSQVTLLAASPAQYAWVPRWPTNVATPIRGERLEDQVRWLADQVRILEPRPDIAPPLSAPVFEVIARALQSCNARDPNDVPATAWKAVVAEAHRLFFWTTTAEANQSPEPSKEEFEPTVRNWARWILSSGDRCVSIVSESQADLEAKLEPYVTWWKYAAVDYDDEVSVMSVYFVFVSKMRYSDLAVHGFSDGWASFGMSDNAAFVAALRWYYTRYRRGEWSTAKSRKRRNLAEGDAGDA